MFWEQGARSVFHRCKVGLHRCKRGFGWCKKLLGDFSWAQKKPLLHPFLTTIVGDAQSREKRDLTHECTQESAPRVHPGERQQEHPQELIFPVFSPSRTHNESSQKTSQVSTEVPTKVSTQVVGDDLSCLFWFSVSPPVWEVIIFRPCPRTFRTKTQNRLSCLVAPYHAI